MLDCTSFPLHVTIHVIDRVSSAIDRVVQVVRGPEHCDLHNRASGGAAHVPGARILAKADEPLANGRLAKEKIAELALKDEQVGGDEGRQGTRRAV